MNVKSLTTEQVFNPVTRWISSVASLIQTIDLAGLSSYNAAVEQDQDRLDINAALDGDDEAYRRIVERYQQTIGRFMWRFSRDRATVEELIQEVFVEAFFSLSGYRGEGSFLSWLKSIATRTGYRFWKKQSKQSGFYSIEDTDIPEKATQGDALDAQMAAELLTGLLAQLKDADRLVLTLMYFEDCSIEEIAKHTGWNRAMVKMRAYRARNRLKELADKQGLWEKLGWIE